MRVSITIALLMCISCTIDKSHHNEMEVRKSTLDSLSALYGAYSSWQDSVWDYPYSVDLERFLMQHTRPISLYGDLNDIYEKEGSYYLVLQDYSSSVWFVISCNHQHTIDLINSRNRFVNCAVVAQITTLERPSFTVSAEPFEIPGTRYVDYDIIIEYSNVRIARGVCIDLVVIG